MVLLCAYAWSASAQSPRAPDPYELDLSIDVPVLMVASILAVGFGLRAGLVPPHCAPRCERDTLPAFDRFAAGRFDRGARTASDIMVASVLAGGSIVAFLDGGIVDLVVAAEAVLVSSALAVVTTMAVRRPRPLVYGEAAPLDERTDGGAALSFFSGHTANSFAAAFAVFHGVRARHPGGVWQWIALGTGVLLASGVGVGRVLAGDHFPSDVLAGAAVGGALGWLVPTLHRQAPAVRVAPAGGSLGLQLSGIF